MIFSNFLMKNTFKSHEWADKVAGVDQLQKNTNLPLENLQTESNNLQSEFAALRSVLQS